MREQTITFFTKAHFCLFFFFQNHAWKLGVQLIHECGLYTSFYGNLIPQCCVYVTKSGYKKLKAVPSQIFPNCKHVYWTERGSFAHHFLPVFFIHFKPFCCLFKCLLVQKYNNIGIGIYMYNGCHQANHSWIHYFISLTKHINSLHQWLLFCIRCG